MLFPCDTLTRHCQSLDGVWRLAFDGKRIGIDRKYFLRPPSDTEDIAVPSSINELVSERSRYLNMDWVWYFRDFYVPAEWMSRRVFLHFGSATHRAEVFLNGRRLGGHEGGFLPFEFELTDRVHADRPNRLAVRVDNLLSARTVPQGGLNPKLGGVAAWRPETLPDVHYDHFPFMGLHRPVTLYSTGRARIENLRLTTLSLKAKSACVRIEGDFSGEADTLVASCAELGFEQRIGLKGPTFDRTASLTGIVPWSPETPRIYDIELTLLADGQPLDHYVLPFGLRTIKVARGKLLLNGRAVFLRGFGRHEDAAIHGKGQSLPHIVKDHNLLRWVGANSFRTSHYPYSE